MNVPAWLSYFDAAYLAAKFGQCFRDLSQGEKAEQYARRSLNMDGRYVRGKAFNQTLLAVAHVQQKQVDQACAEGRTAVDLVADLASNRAAGYVKDLRRRLEPYACTQVVRSTSTPRLALLRCCQPQRSHIGTADRCELRRLLGPPWPRGLTEQCPGRPAGAVCQVAMPRRLGDRFDPREIRHSPCWARGLDSLPGRGFRMWRCWWRG
ncbi:MAG: hypothetical protein JWN00_4664 [Actinomycetia bacterium]|nr:hypothetical protein [Actinomycetes bacterium]